MNILNPTTNVSARPAKVAHQTAPLIPGPGLPVRPGSLDAFDKPSLVNGHRVERRIPLLMASPVLPTVLARG